ncbi:MAG: MarR family winged helix-turn-helix transcriptional regulator [Acidimicrobiales bacterium]
MSPAPSSAAVAQDVQACAQQVLEVLPRAMRWVRQQTRSHRSPSLSVPQLRALLFVRRRPGGSLSELAAQLGVGLPSASALVERLVRGGRLERSRDPAERRRVALTLTPAGSRELERALGATRARLAETLARVPPAELAQLSAAMATLGRLFEADEEGARRW